MADGYADFEDFVSKRYNTSQVRATQVYKVDGARQRVWSPETLGVIDHLLQEGVPGKIISRLLGIPQTRVSKSAREATYDTSAAQNGLLKAWYNCLEPKNPNVVTLDDYLSGYNGDITSTLSFAADMLFTLNKNGINLPYTPTENDAYLFGANHGNGSLGSNLVLQFTGSDEELDIIEGLVPLERMTRTYNALLYSQAIGRLYEVMGLPKGDRQTQEMTVPDWVKSEGFKLEFLGGLFDTCKHHENYILAIRQSAHVDYKKSFHDFMSELASMFRGVGINLTKKGVSLVKRGQRYNGILRIQHGPKNLAKIRNLGIKFRSSKEMLDVA